MTEAKHTPGPWTYRANETGDTIWIGSEDENAACVPGYADHPGNIADARLIAAAPDMLEALQTLVAQILDYERVNNLAPSPGRKFCWDATERAVAVIDKATGG